MTDALIGRGLREDILVIADQNAVTLRATFSSWKETLTTQLAPSQPNDTPDS